MAKLIWMQTMSVRILVAIILASLVAASAQARDPAQVRAFRRDHPCPATQSTRGACHGWVVDHVVPLCGHGVDAPSNMQWQALAESLSKDARERSYCACLRRKVVVCTWRG